MEIRQGKYRHFKGGLYELIDSARDSETEEVFVIYRPLESDGGLWIRPAKMFFETIERDGKVQPRFQLLED